MQQCLQALKHPGMKATNPCTPRGKYSHKTILSHITFHSSIPLVRERTSKIRLQSGGPCTQVKTNTGPNSPPGKWGRGQFCAILCSEGEMYPNFSRFMHLPCFCRKCCWGDTVERTLHCLLPTTLPRMPQE